MAIDNLNYYVSGLPAGQQDDKYSANPGCTKSKNLDIFSSSKSVKATAWSEGEAMTNSYIDIDSRGNLRMMADGKVYDSEGTLVVDPAVNFISRKISYSGENGTYENATFGTPKKMFVKYEGDDRKSINIFTDRTQYVYNSGGHIYEKDISASTLTLQSGVTTDGYRFTSSEIGGNTYIFIKVSDSSLGHFPMRLKVVNPASSSRYVYRIGVEVDQIDGKYYYDKKVGGVVSKEGSLYATYTGDLEEGVYLDVPLGPISSGNSVARVLLNVQTQRREGYTGNDWGGSVYVDVNGGPVEGHKMTIEGEESEYDNTNEIYSYMEINTNRTFIDLGEYRFEKGETAQKLYGWTHYWDDSTGETLSEWSFGTVGVRDTDPDFNVTTAVVWNENPYIIANKNGNGYIIPAPIGGMLETPYTAEGIKFLNAIPQDYYLYLVGEDRGVSGLYVYSGQQLVKILGGTEEKSDINLVDNTEQFRFNGTMCNYKRRIVLGTEDGRVFMYGKTTTNNGGAFIHKVDGNITAIKVVNDKLVVEYTKNNIKYRTTFQDAIHSKKYNTEREAEYPITIGNHILEKEEADLYASYMLCKNTSLEFRASANHYQYWSFKGDANITIGDGREVKVGCWSGDYKLVFVEKNGDRYTFRLEGDLPVQTVGNKEIKKTDGTHLINYTEYNNFRRIGKVESDKFKEDKIRFHNINNMLDLPNSHSIQIMVRGKGTANHSPELFSVDLVASQRERG